MLLCCMDFVAVTQDFTLSVTSNEWIFAVRFSSKKKKDILFMA